MRKNKCHNSCYKTYHLPLNSIVRVSRPPVADWTELSLTEVAMAGHINAGFSAGTFGRGAFPERTVGYKREAIQQFEINPK